MSTLILFRPPSLSLSARRGSNAFRSFGRGWIFSAAFFTFTNYALLCARGERGARHPDGRRGTKLLSDCPLLLPYTYRLRQRPSQDMLKAKCLRSSHGSRVCEPFFLDLTLTSKPPLTFLCGKFLGSVREIRGAQQERRRSGFGKCFLGGMRAPGVAAARYPTHLVKGRASPFSGVLFFFRALPVPCTKTETRISTSHLIVGRSGGIVYDLGH